MNVTKVISRAMQLVRAADAGLGGHLSRTVRTGLLCAYEPDPLHPVDWNLED